MEAGNPMVVLPGHGTMQALEVRHWKHLQRTRVSTGLCLRGRVTAGRFQRGAATVVTGLKSGGHAGGCKTVGGHWGAGIGSGWGVTDCHS